MAPAEAHEPEPEPRPPQRRSAARSGTPIRVRMRALLGRLRERRMQQQSGWFIPLAPREIDVVVPAAGTDASRVDGGVADDGFPIPPRELWAGYGNTPEDYLESGRTHFDCMREVLAEQGIEIEDRRRILDFGCSAGRMTRRFKDQADRTEIWGADVHSAAVLWCQQHLSPPFRFVTTTSLPHLPFEDGFFDLIVAGSVFTHIGDLEDAWLMELRRVLAPGGKAYVTVHDNATIDILLGCKPGHWLYDSALRRELLAFEQQNKFVEEGFSMLIMKRDARNAQVYHDQAFLRQRWGQFFEIEAIVPEAYGYQSAVVLTRR